MKIENKGEKEGWILLDVEVSADEVAELMTTMYMTLATMNDLHPVQGKTSKEVCEEALGELLVSEFVTDELMDAFMLRAFEDQDVDFVGEPVCNCTKAYAEGQPFAFHLEGALKPVMHLSSYDPVVIDVTAAQVENEEVEEEIAKMMQASSQAVPDPDRDTAMADSLIGLSMTTTLAGETVPALTFESKEYQMGQGNMPEGFDEQVVGMKLGEKKLVRYDGPTATGEVGSYESEVLLQVVLKPQAAELTDAWVDEHFEALSTVGELRLKMREQLIARNAEETEQYCKFLAAKQLAERLEGAIPDAVFVAKMNANMNQFNQMAQQQGLTLAQYCEQMGVTEQQLQQEFMLRTREGLRQELALDALIRHEGLELSDEDMQAYYTLNAPGQEAQFKQMLEASCSMRYAREEALRLKANQWAVDHAVAE